MMYGQGQSLECQPAPGVREQELVLVYPLILYIQERNSIVEKNRKNSENICAGIYKLTTHALKKIFFRYRIYRKIHFTIRTHDAVNSGLYIPRYPVNSYVNTVTIFPKLKTAPTK